MTASIVELLAGLDAFSEFQSEDLAHIANFCSLRDLPPEQPVIDYHECSTTVFFLLSGSVRATMFTQQGREISYQDLGTGEMFGELAAIDQLPRSTSVITREQSLVLQINGEDFLQLMATYPQLAQSVLQKLARVVRFLCERVYNFGALDVNSRVRAELCRLAVTSGREHDTRPAVIEILEMPKHQELANRLATHREAVSRELSALEKMGLISKKAKGSLLILDLEQLKASIDG